MTVEAGPVAPSVRTVSNTKGLLDKLPQFSKDTYTARTR